MFVGVGNWVKLFENTIELIKITPGALLLLSLGIIFTRSEMSWFKKGEKVKNILTELKEGDLVILRRSQKGVTRLLRKEVLRVVRVELKLKRVVLRHVSNREGSRETYVYHPEVLSEILNVIHQHK